MTNFYGLWERQHSLHFIHPEYGTLQRTEFGEWKQEHPLEGLRVLKSESLREAFIEAENPYKKPKSKIKIVKRLRKKKVKLEEPAEEVVTKKPKTINKKVPIKKEKEPLNKKPATKKVNKKGKKK